MSLCTEAIFQTLKGVAAVRQGWIAADEQDSFEEMVIVQIISQETLIGVHLQRTAVPGTIVCGKNTDLRSTRLPQRRRKPHSMTIRHRLLTTVMFYKPFKLNSEIF